MTTMPLRSDFYATDRAFFPLKEARNYRDDAKQAAGPVKQVYRSEMRHKALQAVAAARSYREGRQ